MDKLTLRVPFSQAERKLGRIGRDGEAIVRQVLFDCRDVLRGWNSASIVCAYWRPEDDAPYLVPLTEVESGVFAFVVRQEDVAKVGTVRMELRRIDGESVLKSATYTATVEKSINAAPVDPGSPEEDMLTELGEAAGKATLAAKAANEAAASVDESKAAAVAAAEAATQAASKADASAAQADTAAASAEESASKADASAAKADTATANANDAASKATSAATSATESAEKADTAATSATTAATNAQNVADTVQAKLDAGELKGAKGDKGDTGNSGKDCVYMDYTIPAGYTTPYVSTYNVPVTAFTNTPSGGDIIVALHADGYLGRWKVKSLSYVSGGNVVVLALNAIRKITGADGTDGISPTVTTSKADGVTTVTITDKDGAHTATIEDGAKGDKGDAGDLITDTVTGSTFRFAMENGYLYFEEVSAT